MTITTQTIDLANILKRTKEKPMSILIKGIDMPKEGRLKLEITSDGLVWIDTGRRFYAHKDYAIQIDRPHGRLIDADELKEKRETMCWKDDCYMTHESDFIDSRHIDNAPTILEAEE